MAAEVKKVEAEKAVAEEPKKEIPEEKKAEEKAVVPAAPAPDEKALVVSESKKKTFLFIFLCVRSIFCFRGLSVILSIFIDVALAIKLCFFVACEFCLVKSCFSVKSVECGGI